VNNNNQMVLEDNETLEHFFTIGRSLWPDRKEIKKGLALDKTKVPDKVISFMRSTCMNEYGIAHYVKAYYRSYGDNYRMSVWATLWGGEEYLHYLVLRQCLKALDADITTDEYIGLEKGSYEVNSEQYLDEMRVSPHISRHVQQMVYNVLQEYSAYVAYNSVSEAVEDSRLADILRRMANDEMRHCSFFQIALKEYVKTASPEETACIWSQFKAIWNNFSMPQEHIEMFEEKGYATDLYISFWEPKWRSKMAIDLTHYFKQFRVPSAAIA
jgi:rubrerythrin